MVYLKYLFIDLVKVLCLDNDELIVAPMSVLPKHNTANSSVAFKRNLNSVFYFTNSKFMSHF